MINILIKQHIAKVPQKKEMQVKKEIKQKIKIIYLKITKRKIN